MADKEKKLIEKVEKKYDDARWRNKITSISHFQLLKSIKSKTRNKTDNKKREKSITMIL